MLSKVIARSLLIGIIGVSLGIVLAVSGVKIQVIGGKVDWKIYTNKEFGFSFQYPPDWKFSRYDDEDIITIKVYNDRESFMVVPNGQENIIRTPSRRIVFSGKNAVVSDYPLTESGKLIKEVSFYDLPGFLIKVITTQEGKQEALQISKTFRFISQ